MHFSFTKASRGVFAKPVTCIHSTFPMIFVSAVPPNPRPDTTPQLLVMLMSSTTPRT
jgi:hypothetical protein